MIQRGVFMDVYCHRCTFVYTYDTYLQARLYGELESFFWQFMDGIHNDRRFDNAANADRS